MNWPLEVCMRYLQRRFGPHFVSLVRVSPRLVSDLERLRRQAVRIETLPRSIDAWCEPRRNLIAIGTGTTAQYGVMALAHEANHMLRPRVTDSSMSGLSEADYVKTIMEEETDCFCREAQTASDFAAAGIKLTRYARSWLSTWRRGGRPAVRKRVYRTRVLCTRLSYPEYYRRQYQAERGRANS